MRNFLLPVSAATLNVPRLRLREAAERTARTAIDEKIKFYFHLGEAEHRESEGAAEDEQEGR